MVNTHIFSACHGCTHVMSPNVNNNNAHDEQRTHWRHSQAFEKLSARVNLILKSYLIINYQINYTLGYLFLEPIRSVNNIVQPITKKNHALVICISWSASGHSHSSASWSKLSFFNFSFNKFTSI